MVIMKSRPSVQEMRHVSIGFMEPETLERNIIYVQIRQIDGRPDAEAVSNVPFNFVQKSIYGHDIYMKEKRANRRTGYEGMDFVNMVIQQNKAQKEYRYFDDAYRMLGQF
jgi:hypothetical protein